MTRATPPQWSFADLEFHAQNITLDPLLQQISDFIEQHPALLKQVRRDLQRGLKNPATGRNGLDAPQVLRSLTLMRVKNWDYRELRERIADGYTLRQFTQFFSHPVPKHDAFHRAFVRLTPATLEAVNQHVVLAAVALGLEDGKKLRTDTTVVETDIHHPTDSTLLWDTVRVLSRLVGRLDCSPVACGVLPTTAARRAAACKKFNASAPSNATTSWFPNTANSSASVGRWSPMHAKSSNKLETPVVKLCWTA
jgi:IS5 family transposase